MIIKRIEVESLDMNGQPRSRLLEKCGSLIDVSQYMQPDMLQFWNELDVDTERYAYVLVNIMGASEFWGPNKNGDAFPEVIEPNQGLLHYYKTFEQAHVYLNHENNDPKKSIGKVIFASYNPIMHRVEILEQIDKSDPKAIKLISAMELGRYPRVSMGCRVPADYCSICNNRAPSRDDYCVHARTMLNKLLPDGRVVCVINKQPRFFDASMVGVEADPSSGVIVKVAMSTEKDKDATIEKDAPVKDIDTEGMSKSDVEEGKEIDQYDKDMSEDDLERISDRPLSKILATTGASRIALKPKEFTFIIVRKNSGPDMAHRLFGEGMAVPPIFDDAVDFMPPVCDMEHDIDGGLAKLLEDILPERSMYTPHAKKRVIVITKLGSALKKQNKFIPINNIKIGRLYGRYIQDLIFSPALKLHLGLKKHAWLQPLLMDVEADNYKQAADICSLEEQRISLARLRGAYKNATI